MTMQELRIAKLAKILNSSMLDKNSNSPVIKDAYSRAYDKLQKTIDCEKAINSEYNEREKVKASIEEHEEIIKENMRKHHFSVLKKQIEYRHKQRDLHEAEKLLERPKPLPQTPPEPLKIYHRENLKNQIKAKKKKTRDIQNNEIDMDRFFIRVAKNSLEDDIKRKKQEKDKVFSELKESWEKAKTLNKMKKEAEKLQAFGNLTLKKNARKILPFQRSKSKESPQKIQKKLSKSLLPSIKKSQKINHSFEASPVKEKEKKVSNPVQRSYDSKPKSQEMIAEPEEQRSKASPTKEDIEKRLEFIKMEEERIKSNKREILEYLASRSKSKA